MQPNAAQAAASNTHRWLATGSLAVALRTAFVAVAASGSLHSQRQGPS